MTLTELTRGKRVLFVPIFSMRDRKTGTYHLENDGNFARLMSFIMQSDLQESRMLIPWDYTIDDVMLCKMREKNVDIFAVDCYGQNARETRMTDDFFEYFVKTNGAEDFDLIIAEPNHIVDMLIASTIVDKLVYWCVASTTTEGTPWFVAEWTDVDKRIAQEIPTACANQAQVDFLGGKAFLEPCFYDAKLFDYQTIFFPFRLTDENYHAEEFASVIRRLNETRGLKPFKVLYTDVNNSGIFDEEPECFKKVSSDHDVYLNILKGRPIIPYLEHDDVLEHISIHEFLYYNCEVIMLTQKHKRTSDNIIYIDDISCLYESLVTLLKEEKR